MNTGKEFGQTLIETVVGIFILVMGISSAVGLANYALSSTANVTRQLIGMGLAREGAEAVRNMRDTNWLKDTLAVNECWNYETSQDNAANCYLDWLGANGASHLYCLDPSSGNGNNCNGNQVTKDYYLGFEFNTTTKDYQWIFRKNNDLYGLNFDSSNSGGTGFYFSSSNVSCLNASSDYCRSIKITKITTPPYDKTDIGPLLLVESKVWWIAKNCPRVNTFEEAPQSCRIKLSTYLTNWRNY